MDNKEFER